jgi:crotonobetainyl-CoA:carnitine CoA-transferase CaiB-like acyl-CoA transferase
MRALASHDPYGWLLHVLTEKYPDAYSAGRPFTEDGPMSPLFAFVPVALSGDGEWLQFSQVGPHLFRALLRWLDLEWMLDDPEWAGAPVLAEQEKRNKLWDLLLTAVRRRTTAEWQQVFEQDRNVWAEVFRRGSELLDHPQLIHDRQVIEVSDPERGTVRQPGRLVRLDSEPFSGSLPPGRDAHGAELRRGLPDESAPSEPVSPCPTDAPLAGVTVLELGIWFAGPYGATLLTDLGARVIKVESLEGDPLRATLPFPEAGGARVTQGKESVAVDMRSDKGRDIVYQLVAKADVVLQSFRAGVAERLGVGAETLRAINPELIYLNAPGYGTDGPCGDKPAFAPAIGAATGLAMRNLGASLGHGPDLTLDEIKENSVRLATVSYSAFASSDGLAALGVSTSVLLGLLARRRGKGARVMTTSMLSTVAHALSEDLVEYADRPSTPGPDDELHGFNALYRLYQAAEGWVFLAAPQDHEWNMLTAALSGYTDLLDAPCFATAERRREHDADLVKILDGVFRSRPAAEWERELIEADIGCVQVTEQLPEDYLQGDFGRLSGLLVDITHPTFDTVPRLGPLVAFSRSAVTPKGGCLVGQHTDAVLHELGYSADYIQTLRDVRVVG